MTQTANTTDQRTRPRGGRISSRGDTALAYLQLLRLPNLPTAVADVMMGALVAQGSLQPTPQFGLLVASSATLYLAGMVLNDVFDADIDAQERPDRPIPSGRISLATAKTLGWGLLGTGIVLGWTVSYFADNGKPGILVTLLALSLLLYNAVLKQTRVGPLGMGLCRAINVLMGMSLTAGHLNGIPMNWQLTEWLIVCAIGIYIVGVTWFAKTEAKRSSRAALSGGLLVLLAGIAIIASLPAWPNTSIEFAVSKNSWFLFWAVIALIISRRFVLAIVDPCPRRVQAAVKNGILSLIVIDAGVTVGICGVYWGCAVLLLLAPAVVLGKWVYST